MRLYIAFSIFITLTSTSLSARLLDKILAVVNDSVITHSQVKRIRNNITARENIFPQVYDKKKYTDKTIVNILLEGKLIRHKLGAIGYVISDDQVESQIKGTEKRLGLNRKALLQFLKSNATTFDEYFEIIRSTIEYNIFVSRVISPLISITDQEIKNTFFKMNRGNKTLAFKYNLIDFSINQRLIKKSNVKYLKKTLKKYHATGELPEAYSELQTNLIDDISEGGLTRKIKKALKQTDEGEFSNPVKINNDYHVFFVKKKDLVESDLYIQNKKSIHTKLFNKSLKNVTKLWYAREASNHYIKYFF